MLWLRYAVGVLVALGFVTSLMDDGSVFALWVVVSVLLPLLRLGLAVRWPGRPYVLAAGALLAATWSADIGPLWLVALGFVFFSLIEDPRPQPWAGWLGGLMGSALAIVVYAEPTAAPLLATAMGGGPRCCCARSRGPRSSRARRPGSSSGPRWPASCTTWSATT